MFVDLSIFFEWYVISKIPDTKIFKATLITEFENTLLIKTILPDDIEFSDKAYDLMRCKKNPDGSWLLYIMKNLVIY